MKRLLYAAAALSAAGFAAPAFSQMTPVTATHLQMGGVDIASGTVMLTPVDQLGNAISIVTSDGKVQGNNPSQPIAFSATVTAGAIAGGFTVPDQTLSIALTSNTPINYQVYVLDAASKKSFTYRIPYTNPVVSGSSPFALDHYAPSQAIVVSNASIVTQPTAPAHCTGAQIWYSGTNPASFGVCVGGVFVPISGTGGSATTDASQLTSGILNNARLANIPNSALANPSITVNGTAIPLGGSVTTPTGVTPASVTGLRKSSGSATTDVAASSADVVAVIGTGVYDASGAATAAQSAAATDATAKVNALRPTVTAGTGGVAINTLVSKDGTSNPVRYVTSGAGACGSPALASATSGSTFMLADAIGTWSVLTDSGGAVANHLLTGSTITPGTLADTGQTDSANIPSTTCIAGTAQATVAGGALATVLPHARGSYGRLLLAQNVNRDISLLTPNLGSFPITVPTTTVFCFAGDSTHAGVPAAGTSAIDIIFRKTPIGAAAYANGATRIVNTAVAGTNINSQLTAYATGCHNYRPGQTLGDGTVIGTMYFIYWSYWNNEPAAGATNVAGIVNKTQQMYALAKADGAIVVGATAMQDPSQTAGTEYFRQQYNAQIRALKSFYNTTTVSACVTANACGYDYLNDLDALIPDLKQPFQTNGDGVTVSYNLVGSDGRHPSDTAAYLEMYNLNKVLLLGSDTLPQGAPKPYGEVAVTSATTAIPPFATLATITLSGNYSPTWAAPPNPNVAPRECIQFVQDATGGRTVTWPSNVKGGFTVGATASLRSQQCFQWSISQTAWVAESGGTTNY